MNTFTLIPAAFWVAVLGLFIVSPLATAYLAIAPLHQLMRVPRRKPQVFTIDLIALLVVVQVALAIVLAVLGNQFNNNWWPGLILISSLLVVLWWAGVDALSQLGIRQAQRRLMMHLCFLPGVCALMIATVAGLVSIHTLVSEVIRSHYSAMPALLTTLTLLAAIAVGIWFLRSMAIWIARGHEFPSSPVDSK